MDDSSHLHRMGTLVNDNAQDLGRELDWVAEILDARLKLYFHTADAPASIDSISPPAFSPNSSTYSRFIHHHGLSIPERVVVLLAMIPHIRPQLLDVLWSKNEITQRGFTEFGGLQIGSHGGFIPTGETAAFIIGGDNLSARFELTQLFEGDHLFARHNILHLSPVTKGTPLLSGALTLSDECLHWFTTGLERKPTFNSEFPARLIETPLEWEDLVLPYSTLEQLEEIKQWILHGQHLLEDWGMNRKLPPGYTSLFYGPPGTGKTLSASLLGKYCQRDVYKIDLSMVVSKYIGETEKNLAKIFDLAEHKDWILFFDEADALFGKRTKVDDSHDRFANQEISFLLQRIEEYSGVAILATNLKGNIDNAFIRRFQSVVHFPLPKPEERFHIWENAFSPHTTLEPDVDLSRVADKYELSGGTIMNVVRYSSLKAISRNQTTILLGDLEEGIRKECFKEGRTL